ncbi:hypothetical protein [Sporosarcina sp. FSL K6-1508]|uniref:hypothetical protein n=1 Tax=Sporosarcina sp. FSL K6-1508 TaxID=2921553 RepID=UPI0030F58A8F
MSVREHDEQITTELQQLRKSIEKVKVSREVADFVKAYENNVASCNGWEDDFIYQHSQSWIEGFEKSKEESLCMKNISPFELSCILVKGYEVEQTPEENLLDYYNAPEANVIRYEEKTRIVEITLEILGIKIKGVNE